jgi:hypothetical protein
MERHKRPTEFTEHLRDAGRMRRLYAEHDGDRRAIAEAIGASELAVARWLDKHRIERCDEQPHNHVLDERLRELANKPNVGEPEIARQAGVTTDLVELRMLREGITMRGALPPDEVPDERLLDAEWLRRRYEEDGANLYEIADETGVRRKDVREMLLEAGVYSVRLPHERLLAADKDAVP